ncbi:sulfur carrier protein ThiS adenylyltransferase ThiF [Limisalsivibrio acetivorans]|uniref:sulfur carrier protein ThiS adenylyltransferase ThiF n=1 Tax=Limisalsivibrio acetivorans TaxID=1304888 RepID=UPI0003B68E72|nr:sulfur carrier protein ThiS adenylyltransferase ThiF [Limisalsivibrio acetivorans]
MKIHVNERLHNILTETTAFSLRDEIKPDADIIIVNGHWITDDYELRGGEHVHLIKRGEMPDPDELEALLMSRHTPGVHNKLKRSKIGIAGLGGLGSNAAVSLARMGVGSLVMVDFDIVTPANINRQHYYIDQIGKKKTDALWESIERINPYSEYVFKDVFLTSENAGEVFEGCDVVIEALDKAEFKTELIQGCSASLPETLIIAASGIAGYEDTLLFKRKRLGRNIVIIGDFENGTDVGIGLMASRVAAAANIQANLAVRYLLGNFKPEELD